MDNDVTKNGAEGVELEVKTGLNFEIAEGEELSISEVAEQSLIRGGCGVFTKSPHTSECVSADEIIGVKFNR